MKTKQAALDEELVSLSVRVSPVMARRLKELADAEFRPVAAEIRRLIQERIDAADEAADEAQAA